MQFGKCESTGWAVAAKVIEKASGLEKSRLGESIGPSKKEPYGKIISSVTLTKNKNNKRFLANNYGRVQLLELLRKPKQSRGENSSNQKIKK